MKRSSDRILTTHAGALPQPPDLKQMHTAQIAGKPVDPEAFAKRVREVVAQVVKKQMDCGLDIINDGEVGKSNFSRYARERLCGFIEREVKPEDRASTIFARDMVEFGDYFNKRTGNNRGDNIKRVFCNAPLKYVGQRRAATGNRGFQSRPARTEVRGGFSSRHRARHHRTLDEERLLSQR